jgi:hypothetical protein
MIGVFIAVLAGIGSCTVLSALILASLILTDYAARRLHAWRQTPEGANAAPPPPGHGVPPSPRPVPPPGHTPRRHGGPPLYTISTRTCGCIYQWGPDGRLIGMHYCDAYWDQKLQEITR